MNSIDSCQKASISTSNLQACNPQCNNLKFQQNFNKSTSGAKSFSDMMQEQLYMFTRYLIEEIKLQGGSVNIAGNITNTSPSADNQDLLRRAHIANTIESSNTSPDTDNQELLRRAHIANFS